MSRRSLTNAQYNILFQIVRERAHHQKQAVEKKKREVRLAEIEKFKEDPAFKELEQLFLTLEQKCQVYNAQHDTKVYISGGGVQLDSVMATEEVLQSYNEELAAIDNKVLKFLQEVHFYGAEDILTKLNEVFPEP